MAKKQFRVVELFAGVGGFRLGLEGSPSEEWETEELKFENTGFKVVWSNQWEPGSEQTMGFNNLRETVQTRTPFE